NERLDLPGIALGRIRVERELAAGGNGPLQRGIRNRRARPRWTPHSTRRVDGNSQLVLLPRDDVSGRSLGQFADRRQRYLRRTSRQIVPQLIQERLHAARDYAPVPFIDESPNGRLIEQLGDRR